LAARPAVPPAKGLDEACAWLRKAALTPFPPVTKLSRTTVTEEPDRAKLGLGPGTSRERVGEPLVIGADRRRSGPSFVLPKGVPHGKTETGGMVLAAMCWAPSAQRRCHPKEALYSPTFSHLLIVKKPLSLSLSLSLSLARARAQSFSHAQLFRVPAGVQGFCDFFLLGALGGEMFPTKLAPPIHSKLFFMSKLQKPPPSTPCFTAFCFV